MTGFNILYFIYLNKLGSLGSRMTIAYLILKKLIQKVVVFFLLKLYILKKILKFYYDNTI